MPKPQTLLLVLDVQGVVNAGELKALLEQEPREVLLLSQFGAPNYLAGSGTPWSVYGVAIEKLAARAQQIEKEAGQAFDFYVGGRAPLPLFVHLGFALQRFGGAQTVIHFDGSGWKLYPLPSPPASDTTFFTHVAGLEGSKKASGLAAVFIDVAGRQPAIDALRDAVESVGERVADVVELRTTNPTSVTPENACVLAQELVRELPRIPSVYPYSGGLAVFVAGPTVLAFAVGRALTKSIFSRVWLTNGAPPKYEVVYELPYAGAREPRALPDAENDRKARAEVRTSLIASIDGLKGEIQREDLPHETADRAATLVDRLRALTYEDTPSNEFRLSISEQKLAFGGHLLEALRSASPERLYAFARLMVIHELWHVDQGILSSNYQEIGRAGVVLEGLDYTADILAVRTLFELCLRVEPTADVNELRARLGHLLDAVLFGVEAFDRALDPLRIDPLAERRLRRYLIWHLQIARARTIRTVADAHQLLGSDVVIELAPLRGHLDTRFDKIFSAATPATEVFVVVDGRLVRQAKRPGFEPEPVAEAIRSFNRSLVDEFMTILVDSNRAVLAPWIS